MLQEYKSAERFDDHVVAVQLAIRPATLTIPGEKTAECFRSAGSAFAIYVWSAI
jgi:hypothetical protein